MNYHVLNNSLVLNYNNKTVVIDRSDSRFAPVLNCIREQRLDDIPTIVDIEQQYADRGLELRDGLLHIDSQPLPIELSDRIIAFKEENLPLDGLLKFWNNLKQNPSFNARKMLFKFLEHNGHPLTSDGCFIAYRGITEDFKDVHSRSFDNRVGSVCEMDRILVDDNPNNTCSNGLHVACFNYAKNFGQKLVEVKVNPRDVVAVPTDYNGTKMRVCRFEVVAECAIMRTEHYIDKYKEESCDNGSCESCSCGSENDEDWSA